MSICRWRWKQDKFVIVWHMHVLLAVYTQIPSYFLKVRVEFSVMEPSFKHTQCLCTIFTSSVTVRNLCGSKAFKSKSIFEKCLHHNVHFSCSTCYVLPGPNVLTFMCEITFKHMAMTDRHINLFHLPCRNKWTQRTGQRRVGFTKTFISSSCMHRVS